MFYFYMEKYAVVLFSFTEFIQFVNFFFIILMWKTMLKVLTHKF